MVGWEWELADDVADQRLWPPSRVHVMVCRAWRRVGSSSRHRPSASIAVDAESTDGAPGAVPTCDDTTTTPTFDVILLDIQMRRMNGDEVCRRLRALGLDIAIVATTGNCSATEISTYKDKGFDAVLAKPFNQQDIRTVLRSLFNHPSTG